MSNSFGQTLRDYRERRGLSLRELQILSGVNYSYIHRLEAGVKLMPSKQTVDALSKALKLSAIEKRGLISFLSENFERIYNR